ncbi:JNK-interacting protein, putative [Pediculus humanus corporis]|uniref:JNK-interacting protein, putative n=1 Tax=Pediculus humanus subsp. corporis TaxID=121224 RepID=E0VXJ8_PEDHC|nr:JNK-interacting protein, putative [Pediculus humanus corporis]EEB18104.1 JNK-interacting protein, putative [Pediculus humanus corporis]
MADTEFEELNNHQFMPDDVRAKAQMYTYCDVEDTSWGKIVHWRKDENIGNVMGGGGGGGGGGERRRRKLPEIPIYRKTVVAKPLTLAEELGSILEKTNIEKPNFDIGGQTRPLTILKCHNYLRDEDSSPDSDKFHSTDVDSGNSTAHSPDCIKSVSPQPPNNHNNHNHNNSTSPNSPSSSSPIKQNQSSLSSFTNLELLDPTHRGLHKFIRRHHDEVEIEIGDPIYVHKEADDLWCEGVNLRTGGQGIFPSAYVVDVDYDDFDPSTPKVKRERFILGYLGSVETLYHKGNSVLCQAVKKIKSKNYAPHSCILEISDTGLRMVDRKKPQRKEIPCHDYFYSLKNVSFCAFHPRDQRYLGFITKHPQCDRFACHVFIGNDSTRPVAESVGRAFQRFYQKFIETAYPVEDIYIE